MNVRKLHDLPGLYRHLGILIYDAHILFSFSHCILHGYGANSGNLLIFLFFSVNFLGCFVFRDRTRF